MSPGTVPRFSFDTMYEPPPLGYAHTVCRYEATTMPRSTAIAIPIGSMYASAPTPAAVRTSIISSVAYAFEESASEENTGSASDFGRSWCSCLFVASARPTKMRFNNPLDEGRGWAFDIRGILGAGCRYVRAGRCSHATGCSTREAGNSTVTAAPPVGEASTVAEP